jgi:biotin transport system ATP-binding protein
VREGFFYALDGVSLAVEAGEFVLVCGANGSGKSLLMSVIAGLDAPSSGRAAAEGRVGIVFQDADSQILGETPREDAAVGPKNLKLPRDEVNRRVDGALRAVGLTAKADFPARFLSGGEKRRLSLAGVLAMDCPVIIFDEPYANLDFPGVRDVNAALESLKGAGKTVFVLTHELEKGLALATRLVILASGRIVFDGPPEALPSLRERLGAWGIRYPLGAYMTVGDLLWR